MGCALLVGCGFALGTEQAGDALIARKNAHHYSAAAAAAGTAAAAADGGMQVAC